MTPPRIHHYAIHAPADVLDELIAFYGKLLDMQPGFRPDSSFSGHWLYAGDEPILHLREDAGREAGSGGYLDHIALRCEGLEEMRARLDALGLKYGEFEIQALGQTQLFVKDPAGTSVELNFQPTPTP